MMVDNILLILMFVALGFILFTEINSDTDTMIVSVPLSEEERQSMITMRSNFIDTLLATIQDAWQVPEQEIDATIQLLPYGRNLVTCIVCHSNLILFIIDWDHHWVRINLIQRGQKKERYICKTFSMKHKDFALKKVYRFLLKNEPSAVSEISSELMIKIKDKLATLLQEELQQKENKDHE